MKHLSIDIETYSSVDLKNAGLYRYVQSPDFQVLLFAYSVDYGPVHVVDIIQKESIPTEILTSLRDPDVTKQAYNASFEWCCLNKSMPMPLYQWRCTMLHGLYCGYTIGLRATAEALGLPEDKQKMGVGSALIRTFCIPCEPKRSNGYRKQTMPYHEPDKWQLFKEYCRQDVVTEMEVAKRLAAFPVPDKELELWYIDQQINAHGVAVDRRLINGALVCDGIVSAELKDEATELTGLENPNSVQQLTEWLTAEIGEDITDLTKATVKDLIGIVEKGDTRRMLQIRQEMAKTSVKKYAAMQSALCADSRIRGLLQFYGANRTGRWAGRLVQIQNLPKNYMGGLDHARNLVIDTRVDALKVIYGNVPDTLSQLIRTAFIPSPGNAFIVADFSAIEARVIAWLAGEQWRLDVFATHGKIYEASASQMFGVPLEQIKKGNPEYELRQKGKVAELALGFQGSVGALTAMGALNMGLTEEDLPDIVKRWRSANKRIVDLWYTLENAAVSVIKTGQPMRVKSLTLAREGDPANGQDFFTITLPSGRKLFYVKPYLEVNDRGRDAIYYYGMDQKTKKWGVVTTYGGKLVENCLAGDTLVLTDRGWIPLRDVSKSDLVWDGITWVAHKGLTSKGSQITIKVDGVRMTPDHRLLTEKGWRCASSSEGYHRSEVTLPNCDSIRRIRRKKIIVENTLHLWKRIYNGGKRVSEKQTEVMRMHAEDVNRHCEQHSRDVEPPGVPGVTVDERPMHHTNTSSMGELWRAGDSSLRAMARKFRELLGGHGAQIQTRAVSGSDRCRQGVFSGELPVGHCEKAGPKQAQQHIRGHSVWADACSGSCRTVRNRCHHTMVPDKKQLPRTPFVLGTGCYEPVYDLLNAGPRHRFTVLGKTGPFIVHNCVQAIARDCLAESLRRMHYRGYQTVMHIHDEIILDVPYIPDAMDVELKRVCDIMGAPIDWAPGLPLKADGFVTHYYKKD